MGQAGRGRIQRLEVIESGKDDVYANLALEEVLCRTCPPDVIRMFLCRNTPSLVFGRNQNPWREADLDEARRRGIHPARRASGGGTVYHDAGNLNYGFLMPRDLHDPDRFLHIVLEALHSLGAAAASCRRHSIWVGDRKVGGTAFLVTRGTAMLHGCLLVDTDLEALTGVLSVPARDLACRAVESVPSPVTNLARVIPGLRPPDLRRAILRRLADEFPEARIQEGLSGGVDAEACRACRQRNRGFEWVFGRTPAFEHTFALHGTVFVLTVAGAHVTGIHTQPAADGLGTWARKALLNVPYDGELLAARWREMVPAHHCPEMPTCLRENVPHVAGWPAEDATDPSDPDRPRREWTLRTSPCRP
ncbi:MAG: hypothetical protein JXR77_12650 [Lentisphaeria bacterium]|nr:hypothetical protein [Lentisphaeria bacterium]